MSSSHDHSSCDHGNHDGNQNLVIKRLVTATCLCFAFLIIEVIGGYLAGSLAILSDAAHLFADLASFGIAIIAARLAALPTTAQHTYGLKRAESLAALLSMLSLAIVSIGLAIEAINRLYKNEGNVDGKMMTIVAAIGVFVNVALAIVLGVENHVHMPGAHDHHHDHGHEDDLHHHHCDIDSHQEPDHHHSHAHENKSHRHLDGGCSKELDHQEVHDHSHSHSHCGDDGEKHEGGHDHNCNNDSINESTNLLNKTHGNYQNLHSDEKKSAEKSRNVNLQAAYLHVMGDLAQSFGVLIAGLIIWYNPNWHIMDPICTLIFCALVFYSTLGVIRSSISVLLEEVPSNVKWAEIFTAIKGVEGVTNVHDLHIWSISQGMTSMSVHCSAEGDSDMALKRIYNVVKKKGIKHVTIQIQIGKDCVTCSKPCNDELSMNHIVCEEIV